MAMIYEVNELKKQLLDANRDYRGRKTWENLYGSIDLARQQQISQLTQDYSEATAEAYAAAYKSNAAVMSSNLGQGYKLAVAEETDMALEEAYNTYRQNYMQGVSEVESAAAEASAGVTDALTEQAKFTKEYAEAPYEYLKYLWEKQQAGELLDAEGKAINLFDEEMWKRYTADVPTYDAEGNPVLDEDGNQVTERQLKSWDQIVNFSVKDENGEWSGLYDDQRNLTIKGADFYDQMINQLAYERRGISFEQWLNETNEDLYNWSQSYNPYDYTEAGSNEGSFKTMVGLTSTDEKYTFMERFGGLTRKEVDGMFERFTSKITELNEKVNSDNGRQTTKYIDEFESLTSEIKDLTDQLGITEDIQKDMGMSLDDLGKYLANNASNAVSNGDIWWQGIDNTLKYTVGGAATGAATGATTGTTAGTAALPVLGTAVGAGVGTAAGAIIGAIVGLIVGVGTSINQSEQTKAQNKALAQASRDAYDNLVTTLITYSQNKQRQAQIDYYKK